MNKLKTGTVKCKEDDNFKEKREKNNNLCLPNVNIPFLKLFRTFISPREWPNLANMHERVTKHRRVLTLQGNDTRIINKVLLKDIHLKTKLLPR